MNNETHSFKVCRGDNIRREDISRGAGGSFHVLAGWRRVLLMIANGQGLFHGALDTFD